MTDVQALLTGLALLLILLTLALFWRLVRFLFRFALRALLGGGVLAALGPVSGALGLHLGVNAFNLTLLGLLGAPGLGLLLLLNWVL